MWQVLRDWWSVTGNLEVTGADTAVEMSFYFLVHNEELLSVCSLLESCCNQGLEESHIAVADYLGSSPSIRHKKPHIYCICQTIIRWRFFPLPTWICSTNSMKSVLINTRLGWFQGILIWLTARENKKYLIMVIMEKYLLQGQSTSAHLTVAL